MPKTIPVYCKRGGDVGPKVGAARLEKDENGKRVLCIEMDEGATDLELYISTVDIKMLVAESAGQGDDQGLLN